VHQFMHTSVLSNRRNGDRWLRIPPHPCLSTAPAGVLRFSLHVCSVMSVFLLLLCYSLQRPGLVLWPLMASERGAPAEREPRLTREHPR